MERISVKKIIEDFRLRLTALYGEKEVMEFIYLLFREWNGWTRAQVHMEYATLQEEGEQLRFQDALEKLEKNTPIQYITGTVEFLNTKIEVHPGVLIPRPETEELASIILHEIAATGLQESSVLDIGTGSGCLAVSIKKTFQSLEVTATDISESAIATAIQNSDLNQAPVNAITADILDRRSWKNFSSYHVIMSNPPYVTLAEKVQMRPHVVEQEPHVALFVPDDDPMLFYRAIADFSREHLSRPGLLFLEINERFGAEVSGVLRECGFSRAVVLQDIHGKDRFIRAEFTRD
jgi:release factor glutamine methyltransferase